jgi:hypothetical protein
VHLRDNLFWTSGPKHQLCSWYSELLLRHHFHSEQFQTGPWERKTHNVGFLTEWLRHVVHCPHPWICQSQNSPFLPFPRRESQAPGCLVLECLEVMDLHQGVTDSRCCGQQTAFLPVFRVPGPGTDYRMWHRSPLLGSKATQHTRALGCVFPGFKVFGELVCWSRIAVMCLDKNVLLKSNTLFIDKIFWQPLFWSPQQGSFCSPQSIFLLVTSYDIHLFLQWNCSESISFR